jgi:hypothetical protein
LASLSILLVEQVWRRCRSFLSNRFGVAVDPSCRAGLASLSILLVEQVWLEFWRWRLAAFEFDSPSHGLWETTGVSRITFHRI